MIVCSSNAWGGCLPGYVDYIVNKATTADVLCLQEVHQLSDSDVNPRFMPKDPGGRTMPLRLNLFNELQQRLCDKFVCHFAPQMDGYIHDLEAAPFTVSYGNALFIRRTFHLFHYDETLVYNEGPVHNCGTTGAHKSAQLVAIDTPIGNVLISHTHGLWWQSEKGDVFPRRTQFNNWRGWVEDAKQTFACEHVLLCGDFNQVSDSTLIKSLPYWGVFGKVPGRNLTKAAAITDTRTEHYKKDIREADYMFVSPKLRPVLQVDYDVPSDHALLTATLKAVTPKT